METESHAATHVKNEGAGAVFCAGGLGLISPAQACGLIPCLSFTISLFTLHCVQANKAGVHKKIILENKNEGANSDEYQIPLIYSCTISEYKRKVMRLKSGLSTRVTHRFTHYRKICNRNFRIYTIVYYVTIY